MQEKVLKTQEGVFRTDTKALVGAVIIGILFVIMEQVTGRIDSILDPTFLFLNGTTWSFFTGLLVLMYKQPAGVIGGLVEAFVAMATAYTPLAFFFIFANTIGSIAYSIVARNFSMEKLSHHFFAQIGCNVAGNLVVMIGLISVYHLEWKVALFTSLATTVVATIVAGILTKKVYASLQKSALL